MLSKQAIQLGVLFYMNHTKEFLALQNEWYAKLKKDGFEDIEKHFSNGTISPFVKQSCRIDKSRHPFVLESTYSYYHLAGEYLHHGEFETPNHKEIWSLYSEGISYRRIVATLGGSLPVVHKIVKRYEKRMFEFNENNIEAEYETPSNEV